MRHRDRDESGGNARKVPGYAPHRAILALGAVLVSVTAAGGMLGVVNSGRAERSAAVLTDRYLLLQPPMRDFRAGVAEFQAVAERAFSGSSPAAALVVAAVHASTVTDQAYLELQRLLSLPINRDLGGTIAPLHAAYVGARSSLASILAGGTQAAKSAELVTAERSAGQAMDTAMAALQSTVTERLVRTAGQARGAARTARDDLMLSVAIGIAFGAAVTALVAASSLRSERELARRDAIQLRVTRRGEFESQLQRALEMARSEPAVFDLVGLALAESVPDMRSELLLADSSRAHFRQVLVTPTDTADDGCGVVSPDDCPAVGRGQPMVFPLSTAMDACPHLRGRNCSALCVPVNISGNSIGVVHVTAADGSPPGDAVRRDVEVVATRASECLAMLRSFALSRDQANSDSLTGLLTRRSLESRIRDLNDAGAQYAVAYGDLDHFKQVNDMFGHDAGDRALRVFSQVLRDGLRPSDIPCRYGGEEFVIVLPACPVHEAVHVLQRVRERMAVRLASGLTPAFTVSFGVASSEQAVEFEQVVALADAALLQAKAAGRDQIIVSAGGPRKSVAGPDGEAGLRCHGDSDGEVEASGNEVLAARLSLTPL